MLYRLEDTHKVSYITKDNNETMLLSCIQKVKGEIYVNDLEHPESIVFIIGEFCFLFGKVNHDLKFDNDFMIVVCDNEQWARFIENHYTYKKVTRYALKKERDVFDKKKLQRIIDMLDKQYRIKKIDEDLYNECKKYSWSKDLVASYNDYIMFKNIGLGFVIMKDKEIIAGASSYSTYKEGIEIEIDTKQEYRRQGLASIIGARLILECLDRNLYPSWDAHTKISLCLAERLGYHFDYEYIAYEIYSK